MEYRALFQSLCALLFVLGLIGIISLALRRWGPERLLFQMIAKKKSEKRLAVEEMLPLDAKHRLVLIRHDDKEHLLLLGMEHDTVIETVSLKPKTKKIVLLRAKSDA